MAVQQCAFAFWKQFFSSLQFPRIEHQALQSNAAAVLLWACVHLIKSTVPFEQTVHGGEHLTD